MGSKLRSLKANISSLRLEVLFQSIEPGQAAEKLRQDLDDLQARKSKMSWEYFQSLRLIFGPSRFQMVQEFVDSWEPEKGMPYSSTEPPNSGSPRVSR